MFKNKQTAKSILILQKKDENVKPPKQAIVSQFAYLYPMADEVEKILLNIDRLD